MLALCVFTSYGFLSTRYCGFSVRTSQFDQNFRSSASHWLLISQQQAKKGATVKDYEDETKLDGSYDSYEEDDADTEYILSGQGPRDAKKTNE